MGGTKMGVSYTKLASVVAVAAVVGAVIFHQPVNAAPATFTWTGATGDGKMSTAGNWEEGSVPTAGSKLVFKCVPEVNGQGVHGGLHNDLTVAFSGLEAKKLDSLPAGRDCTSYIIDKMQFTPDAEFTGDHTGVNGKKYNRKAPFVSIDAVTGLSNMKSNGYEGMISNGPNYTLTLNRYEVANAGCNKLDYYVKAAEKIVGENASVWLRGANNILVKNKGQLGIYHKENETSASKITFENGTTISHGLHCMSVNVEVGPDVTTVLSGDIVLNGDVEFRLESNVTIKITGKLSGPGRLIAHRDNEGTILVESSNNTSSRTPNGLYGNAHEPKLIKLDGEKPNEVLTVKKGETVLLNGSRSMNVYEGGVINGNITGGEFNVCGVVSLGNNSPSKNTMRVFVLQDPGVYKVKILNKDHYDQIAAEGVGLVNGRLDLTYLEGGVIKKGDTFTIIDNKGPYPIEGNAMFKDLPEGAEVTVGGAIFKISYVGGDGNDVVLTALNDSVAPKASVASKDPKAPKVPNTGGEKLAVNLIGAIAGVASAAALLIVAKRKSFNKK